MRYGLRDWARREPHRVALRFSDGQDVTYARMEALANRFAHLFRATGLKRGDHAAVILDNDPHMLAAAWGAYRAGIYLTPVAHTFSSTEVASVVTNCEAQLVVADARFSATAADLPARSPALRRALARNGAIAGFESLEAELTRLSAEPIDDESPGSLMLYSSGTTGAPKGVWRPLPTLEAVGDGPPPFARDLLPIFGMNAETRYLSPAPLYHAAPLRWCLAVTAAGGMCVIMKKFDAEQALDLLVQETISVSQWVPTMFRRLLALPEQRRAVFHAPAHRVAWSAAAPCSPLVKRAMIAWWGPIISEYYSGSESVGLALIDAKDWLKRPDSVGKVVKGAPHILDEYGRELPPGEVGTIYFSGISKFEYFKEPAKTASRTSPQGYQTFGDVGRLDEEGFLYLTDRLDDMIISGGVNLYPQEIELALEQAPGVAECAVVGVRDEEFGERPVAFVVRAPGGDSDEAFVEALTAYCRVHLGRTKQLRGFHIVEALPRTPTGKLLRRVLRETAGLPASTRQ